MWLRGKESACQVSIPGSGRSPGRGNGNPLQHSCLGNPMDPRAGPLTVYGFKESDRTKRPSTHAHMHMRPWEVIGTWILLQNLGPKYDWGERDRTAQGLRDWLHILESNRFSTGLCLLPSLQSLGGKWGLIGVTVSKPSLGTTKSIIPHLISEAPNTHPQLRPICSSFPGGARGKEPACHGRRH